MTRTTIARIAGVTFLVYIAAGVSGMAYPGGVLLDTVLSLVMCFSALVLAVTLYGITRDEDPILAMLGLTCRVGEGVVGAAFMPIERALLSLGTSPANAPDAAAATALRALLASARGFNMLLSATFFAVGSTVFCWLLLRGRIIPRALAWLGVLASVLLVVALPVQLAGLLSGPIAQMIWLPMLVFELVLAFWLIVKGAAAPAPESA